MIETFVKFVISVRGDHCDHSPPAPNNLTTSMAVALSLRLLEICCDNFGF